jgi:hypothetical protein
MSPVLKALRSTRAATCVACVACAMAVTGARAQDAPATPADPHDFPTSERVTYVEACMRDHPGMHYEMLNKCSCALDLISQAVTYDDYVTMSTATNATSIGGERGAYIRDVPELQTKIRDFRKLQADAQRRCMIAPPAPR